MRAAPLFAACISALALALCLSGCGETSAPPESAPPAALSASPAPAPTAFPTPTPCSPPTPSPLPTPSPSPSAGIVAAGSAEDIKAELSAAISGLRQPRAMDVSAVELGEHPELSVKNLYHSLLSENRSFCTAYDLTASVSGGILEIELSYMPYATGNYPPDFEGESVSSLPELMSAANAHLGAEPLSVRITDASLTPDDMNRALQQVGLGYVICTLSRDATQVIYAPASGFTMEECLGYISECGALADEAAARLVTEDMDEAARARALYGYLTGNVKYDQRYYSDRQSMPYHSQTALGALRDGLAICGGYSHALKLLFERAGLSCYNVSGSWGSEYHMWNAALLDGEWLYFDATGDRGVSEEWWKYFSVPASGLKGHSFDPDALPWM